MNAGSVVGYHEVVGTLKPTLCKKNLFELFALTGRGDSKIPLPNIIITGNLHFILFHTSQNSTKIFKQENSNADLAL